MAEAKAITPAVAGKVISAVRNGSNQGVAARAAGISRQTLTRALTRGRTKRDSLYGAFYDSYHEALEHARVAKIAAFREELKRSAS